MTRDWMKAAVGCTAAAVIATAARRARALSPGGAVAATVVGGVTVTGAGIAGSAALVAFFVSSTLLGRLPRASDQSQRRGNERDAVQVLANGGVATLLAFASAAAPGSAPAILHAGVGGAIAAATADTWATEIGIRSRMQPRSIASWKLVPPGASGGVTWAGLAASGAGAAMIAGVVSAGAARARSPFPSLMLAVTLGGFTGALADSLLGSTLQEVRFCDACLQETEMPRHRCGQPTHPIRGYSWCDNDAVNAIATAVGAATAMSVVARFPDRPDKRRPTRSPVGCQPDIPFDNL